MAKPSGRFALTGLNHQLGIPLRVWPDCDRGHLGFICEMGISDLRVILEKGR